MNQEVAYTINENTIRIAQESTKLRAVLYVYVCVVNMLHNDETITIGKIARRTNANDKTVRKCLDWLAEGNYIVLNGSSRVGYSIALPQS